MFKIIALVITMSLSLTGLAAFASLFEPLPNPVTGEPLSFALSTIGGSLAFHLSVSFVAAAGFLMHTVSRRQFG